VLYVIILSAALDLVGPNIPKGTVLLADVFPSFLTKLIAPYFISAVPYSARVFAFVILSTTGMLMIAVTADAAVGTHIGLKLCGVLLASLSSGGGELSFLGLTHYYGHSSLAAWGSGTGAAGLVGAGLYAFFTTAWGITVQRTLYISALLPIIMLLSFFLILPQQQLAQPQPAAEPDQVLHESEEAQGLLESEDPYEQSIPNVQGPNVWSKFNSNLSRAKSLFLPYMLPLLLVYIAEYSINQGVSVTLLFPLKETPFKSFREFYPVYNAIYQVGVFISRSSTPFYRTSRLYLPSILQCINLLVLSFHAIYDFLPNVYIVFAIIFWEGLLGGLVYVNTFHEISDNVPVEDREFSLGATSVSDSGGIVIASFIAAILETNLCKAQVARGRDYCKKL
jgi:battenin